MTRWCFLGHNIIEWLLIVTAATQITIVALYSLIEIDYFKTVQLFSATYVINLNILVILGNLKTTVKCRDC